MKFLFVARNPSLFVQYERVIKGLINSGHNINFHLVSKVWRNAKMDTELLANYSLQTDNSFRFCQALQPSGVGATILRHKREIVNYAAYLRKDNPISNSQYMIDRQRLALYQPMHILLLNRIIQKYILKSNRFKKLSFIENSITPDRRISELLKDIQPDLVLASPFIFSRSTVETEYIKCAKTLGIPTCTPIFSWDNLTSKGIFQIIPDSVLVWNEKQIIELENIHGVEAEKAIVTGAPSLDTWFEKKPQYSHKDFCLQFGLRVKPYILYLCSSQTIARDENVFVEELITYLQSTLGENCPTVVIRPHPLNIDIWNGWNMPGSIIIPKSSRDIFYSIDAKNLMFESIYHCTCVVGLNTTAMIETAIIGKPCFTLIVDKYSNTQEMSGHFHHLSDAGFMYSTRSMDKIADKIYESLQGSDEMSKEREAFVFSFVRPNGLDVSSSWVMQFVLEKLGKGFKLGDIRTLLKTDQGNC